MPTESSLFKRIKRHVIGRERKFFAATPPGFEPVCLSELLKFQPGTGKARATPGGVEFEGRLDVCYHANLNLRSANRILMRIHAFKSSNFRQLEKKVRDIPWELYLQSDNLLNVHVTTKHCRLHHSGAISEKFQKAITRRLSGIDLDEKIPGAPSAHQNIFVRGVDDRFSVSIDSSGDLLYKRGLKKHTGKAPLRETLAAAALMLAGYDSAEPLLDPLCGAGTFSLEAALMAKRIPAGWFRDFAFTQWPSFLTKRWNYIRRQSESGFVRPEQPMVFASDTDPGACQKLKRCVEGFGLSDTVQVHQKDFFDLDPRELTDQTGIICLNPPYGRRLGGRQESEKFFGAICDKLKQAYTGWKLVLFAPSRKLAGTIPFQTKSYPILHGGLKLALLIGKIQ
jgi:putative N6-adenine-specific DNA methylase